MNALILRTQAANTFVELNAINMSLCGTIQSEYRECALRWATERGCSVFASDHSHHVLHCNCDELHCKFAKQQPTANLGPKNFDYPDGCE